MAKFRKLPVVIDAMRFEGGRESAETILEWATGALAEYRYKTDCIEIMTLEGDMIANSGDWIIRGVQGEYYPCKPDIFDATYEPVDEP